MCTMVHSIHPQARIHPGNGVAALVRHAPGLSPTQWPLASKQAWPGRRPGALHLKGAPLTQRCWQHMGIMHRKGIRSAGITWWIRAMRLIRCILLAV